MHCTMEMQPLGTAHQHQAYCNDVDYLSATASTSSSSFPLPPDDETMLPGRQLNTKRASFEADNKEFEYTPVEKQANANTRDARGWAAIHHAAYENDVSRLQNLLNRTETDVNALVNGKTALHLAIRPSRKIQDKESCLRCIKLLMDNPNFVINRPDGYGQTAIIQALSYQHKDIVKVMLKIGGQRLNLACSFVNDGRTARQNIISDYPELKYFLPEERREKIDSDEPEVKLLAALQHRNREVFLETLQKVEDPNHEYNEPYYCTCLELACRMNDSEFFVTELVRKGANPNTKNHIYRNPVIHQATEFANVMALQVLLRKQETKRNSTNELGHTVLHVAAQTTCNTQEEIDNILSCIELLLEPEIPASEETRESSSTCIPTTITSSIDINAHDMLGNTALHDAGLFGNKAVVLALLRKGADVMNENNTGEVPLAFIDAETLEEFLNEQLKSNGVSPQSKEYEVTIRYPFSESTTVNNVSSTEMNVLQYISHSKDLQKLLGHPVIRSFLDLKWYLVRNIFYANLGLYILFVLFLTSYILLTNYKNKGLADCVRLHDNQNDTISNVTEMFDMDKSSFVLKLECKEYNQTCSKAFVHEMNLSHICSLTVYNIVKAVFENKKCHDHEHNEEMDAVMIEVSGYCVIIAYVLLTIIVCLEIVQCVLDWDLYSHNKRNILDISMIIASTITLTEYWGESNFQQHISALAILLSWTQIICILGRLPFLSFQFEMFLKVSKTFFSFMACYSLIIVAFALSFCILFGRNGEYNSDRDKNFFNNPFRALLKTSTMMTGEVETSQLAFGSVPGTSHVIFVLFVFLIPIILLNLLNGLAVYDTQDIQKDSVILGLISQVNLISHIETMLNKLSLSKLGACCLNKNNKHLIESRIRLFKKDFSKIIHIKTHSKTVTIHCDHDTTNRFRKFNMEREITTAITNILAKIKSRGKEDKVTDIGQRY